MKRFCLHIFAIACLMAVSMAAAAINLKKSYMCEGNQYDPQGQNWNTVLTWTTEPGVEAGIFGEAQVFYNLFPTENIFEGSFGLEYRVEDNNIIFDPTVITFYGDQYIVCAVDADDLRAGGTGAIVLEVGEDGSLSWPEGHKNHAYGYFICSIKEEALMPKDVMYPLMMLSGITFTPQDVDQAADLTGEVREVEINTNAYWTDYTKEEGWFQIFASSDDYQVTVDANTTEAFGEFTDEQLDAAYTYISVWNGKEYKKIKSAESKAKISKDEQTGIVTGELWVREWETGIVWHATLTHDPAKPEPLNYDEQSDVEVTFNKDDIVGIDYDNGAFTVRTCNDDLMILDLSIFSDKQDDDIKIPEGTYPLSTSGESGTAMASSGVIGSSVTQSYVATIDNEGYIDKLWFLVQGNVTVKKVMVNGEPRLSIEIDAINSLCQKVKVTLIDSSLIDGISEITRDDIQRNSVRKMLHNGKLIIMAQDKTFSADGKLMK